MNGADITEFADIGQNHHSRNGLDHYLWVNYTGKLVLINAIYLIETLG